ESPGSRVADFVRGQRPDPAEPAVARSDSVPESERVFGNYRRAVRGNVDDAGGSGGHQVEYRLGGVEPRDRWGRGIACTGQRAGVLGEFGPRRDWENSGAAIRGTPAERRRRAVFAGAVGKSGSAAA